MAELKKAVNKMEEQGIPRAVLSEGILTIDVDSHVETMEEQEDARWHQLLNAHRTKKILTGQLGGIEKLDSGWTVAITYYNGFRILIPMDEMMINLSGDGREHSDTLNRQTRIANNMLGSDIDFIIRDLDEQSRSVVASRKDAMLKKRQMFYFNDLTLVMVNQINIRSVEEMEISVDAKSATANVNKDNLKRCVRQGKYVGIITDVYKGTYFIRLNIGVNAVAHSCNMASLPSKRDEVGFVVTRINDKFEVAEGIITRMIKRILLTHRKQIVYNTCKLKETFDRRRY